MSAVGSEEKTKEERGLKVSWRKECMLIIMQAEYSLSMFWGVRFVDTSAEYWVIVCCQ